MVSVDEARKELARRELERRSQLDESRIAPSYTEGQARMIANALTIGTQPILSAGVAALAGRTDPGTDENQFFNYEVPIRERYQQNLEYQRQRNAAYREKAPVASTITELGTAALTPYKLPGKATTFAGQTGRAALEGSAYGLGYALGEGEDPYEAMAISAAFGVLGNTAIRGLQKIPGGMQQFANEAKLLKNSPTVQQLRFRTAKLYERANKSGIRFGAKQYQKFVSDLTQEMRSEGARPGLADKAVAVLREMADFEGNPGFQDMDELRRLAGIAASSSDKAESRLGSIIIDKIDEFVDSGSGVLGKTGAKARELWGRVRKDELVSSAIEKARLNPSGIEQGLRVQFRQILSNPKKMRGFTAEEKKILERVVNGTGLTNVTRALGKMGFRLDASTSNIVGGGLSTGLSGLAGGVPAIVATQATAAGSRMLSATVQERNARVLQALIKNGRPENAVNNIMNALVKAGENEKLAKSIIRAAGVYGATYGD